ncbi:toll/interleukin-1 receptor domain-containing protein [Bosea sp. NPDC003192]|uniref:toll/interleukin-1 receptor domain-containing protein n=1 Tax=Bosea sp. NPDC003192 TaxID=3390551 RepID=UPI003D012FE6
MIEYPSKSLLERFAREIPLTEQASVRKRAEDRSPSGATFLSHSSQDGEWVVGAIRLLEGHGATVYIDKKDSKLPPYTNKETAAGLKNRIHQSHKFVLLASNNSKDSRWVPWELGIADEHKGLGRIAILPAVDSTSETSWTSWEYLGLYNRIVWGDLRGHKDKIWMVIDEHKNTAVELASWLKK